MLTPPNAAWLTLYQLAEKQRKTLQKAKGGKKGVKQSSKASGIKPIRPLKQSSIDSGWQLGNQRTTNRSEEKWATKTVKARKIEGAAVCKRPKAASQSRTVPPAEPTPAISDVQQENIPVPTTPTTKQENADDRPNMAEQLQEQWASKTSVAHKIEGMRFLPVCSYRQHSQHYAIVPIFSDKDWKHLSRVRLP